MGYAIRPVNGPQELERVGRFRYEVYVHEMDRPVAHADHDCRILLDELDRHATTLAAFADDEVAGTIRINLASDPNAEDYNALYQVERFDPYPTCRLGFVTKLMVTPGSRGGRLAIRLCCEIAAVAWGAGNEFTFIDANDHLIGLYRRLGFREYADPIDHPEYGHVTPMVILRSDREHLRAVRSPLLSINETYPIDPKAVEFFESRFTRSN